MDIAAEYPNNGGSPYNDQMVNQHQNESAAQYKARQETPNPWVEDKALKASQEIMELYPRSESRTQAVAKAQILITKAIHEETQDLNNRFNKLEKRFKAAEDLLNRVLPPLKLCRFEGDQALVAGYLSADDFKAIGDYLDFPDPSAYAFPTSVSAPSNEGEKQEVKKGCRFDNNNDGDCHLHPQGCPKPVEIEITEAPKPWSICEGEECSHPSHKEEPTT